MPQEARKRFTIEFRHHFQAPREVRTIKDRITQRRHKDFIDVFERELGLSGAAHHLLRLGAGLEPLIPLSTSTVSSDSHGD
jgi:hypothetical protein